MALSTVMFLVVIISSIMGYKPKENQLRVIYGDNDDSNEYPYVVCLLSYYSENLRRTCTGSLITKEWVLTASHCLDHDVHQIRYGSMSLPWNETKSYSKILKMIIHPSFKVRFFENKPDIIQNDIGLALVEEVVLEYYGILSAIDYKTLVGLGIKYAGFGYDHVIHSNNKRDALEKYALRPLQIGNAALVKCELDQIKISGPLLCAAPPCDKKTHQPMAGDSGAPLFVQNKIVGVLYGGINDVISAYTPLSPYVDWILDVMSKNSKKDIKGGTE